MKIGAFLFSIPSPQGRGKWVAYSANALINFFSSTRST